jgi:hypothetical protein
MVVVVVVVVVVVDDGVDRLWVFPVVWGVEVERWSLDVEPHLGLAS